MEVAAETAEAAEATVVTKEFAVRSVSFFFPRAARWAIHRAIFFVTIRSLCRRLPDDQFQDTLGGGL